MPGSSPGMTMDAEPIDIEIPETLGNDRNLSGQLPLRSGAVPRASRPVDTPRMQLLGLHKEGNLASDRPAGAIRAIAGRAGTRDLSVQHQHGEAHLLQALWNAPLLCAAVGSGQDQRQCPLSRRHRSGGAAAAPLL